MHDRLAAGERHGASSAETGSGHLLTMDGAPDGGGRNLAPRPMETVLAGTGGCTAYDVVLILQARPPRRARLPGQGRAPSARRPIRRSSRASACTSSSAAATCRRPRSSAPIALSHEKYCSATIMLAKTARDHDQLRDRRAQPDRAPSTLRRSARCVVITLRGRAHRPAHRRRQRRRAGLLGRVGVAALRRPSSARRWRAKRSRRPAGARGGRRGAARPGARSRRRSRGSARRRRGRRPGRCAKAPAYHSGLSRLGAGAEFAQPLLRSRPGGRSRRAAACSNWRAQRRRRGVVSACAW